MISNKKQLNLGLPPGLVKPLEDIPYELVAQCDTVLQAVQLCMRFCPARYSQAWWAEQLNISQGMLNTILNGGTNKRKRYPDPEWFEQVELLAGNRGITQYFELQSKGLLNRQQRRKRPGNDQEYIQQLEDQIARMKTKGVGR